MLAARSMSFLDAQGMTLQCLITSSKPTLLEISDPSTTCRGFVTCWFLAKWLSGAFFGIFVTIRVKPFKSTISSLLVKVGVYNLGFHGSVCLLY